jgi:hypothetical protein
MSFDPPDPSYAADAPPPLQQPPPSPLIHPIERRTDPLEIAGLLTVVAGAAYIGAIAWSYWDTLSDFSSLDDAPSTVDRLRILGNVVNPVFILIVLVGAVLVSLRDLLGLLDLAPGSHAPRMWARLVAGVSGMAFAIGGVAMAVDIAFVRDDEGVPFTAESKWQQVLAYSAAAVLGAVTAWVAARERRPRRAASVAPTSPSAVWSVVDTPPPPSNW